MNTISQFDNESIGEHLREAEMLALLTHNLTSAQNLRLEQHLLICKQCHELYQDACDFALPHRNNEPTVSEAQIQVSWEQLKPFILKIDPRTVSNKTPRPVALAAAAGMYRSWALPAAAALFLSLILIALLLWRERQSTNAPALATVTMSEDNSKPPLNQTMRSANSFPSPTSQVVLPTTTSPKTIAQTTDKRLPSSIHDVTHLVLTSGEKGAAEAATPKRFFIPAQAQQLRFSLTRYRPNEFPVYQVELVDAVGKVRQVVSGSLTKTKQIEAVFRRNGLTNGAYQLRVTGQGRTDADLTPLTTDPIKLSFKNN